MNLTDEQLSKTVAAYHRLDKSHKAVAAELNISRSTVGERLRIASKRGMFLGSGPVMPGFELTKRTTHPNGTQTLTERLAPSEEGEALDDVRKRYGFDVMSKATLHVRDNKVVQSWPRVAVDVDVVAARNRAILDGFLEQIPRYNPIPTQNPVFAGDWANPKLLNQYTITDLHMGMLAWAEENKDRAWDLKIAERTLIAWFKAAIARAPMAAECVFAQIGDMLHHDSMQSVTPAHRHVLDADSRLQKVIRVVLRVIRQIISMLLEKYQRVTLICASGNHDEASGAWIREAFAMHYENEPRVFVDNSPSFYYAVKWGKTGLYYHHGHKRSIKNGIDKVMARTFREIYGACTHNFAHTGHLHHKQVKEDTLMVVEQHRTLAPGDAHASSGGWISGSSADVITYHMDDGEVERHSIRPESLVLN